MKNKFGYKAYNTYLGTMPATPALFLQSLNKPCPHCGTQFNCNAAEDAPCDCFTLELEPETKEYIKGLGYTDCLCNKCLKALNEEVVHGLQLQEY